MTDQTIEGYAAGLLEIARAEGDLDRVGDELFRVARAVESSGELREALVDPQLPRERKSAIVGQLVGGRASTVTVALVDFVVGMDRARDLTAIADRLVERIAADQGKAVAQVRAAVELDDATVQRLEEALSRATGRQVLVKATVDPSVLGGIVAQIGDTVIDGSVRRRLNSLRQSLETRG